MTRPQVSWIMTRRQTDRFPDFELPSRTVMGRRVTETTEEGEDIDIVAIETRLPLWPPIELELTQEDARRFARQLLDLLDDETTKAEAGAGSPGPASGG